MPDSSSGRANRHGIPRRGGTRPRCMWPGCTGPVVVYPDTRLCGTHANNVADTVNAHRAKMQTQFQQKVRDYFDKIDPPPPDPKPEPERLQVIYYLQVGGHIKVGWTSQLEKRMRSYPPNSQLLAVHPGTRAEERALHKRFAVHRSHGAEWYPLVPVLLEHIDRVKAEHGEPEAVTFGARPAEVPRMKTKQPVQLRARSGGRYTRAI